MSRNTYTRNEQVAQPVASLEDLVAKPGQPATANPSPAAQPTQDNRRAARPARAYRTNIGVDSLPERVITGGGIVVIAGMVYWAGFQGLMRTLKDWGVPQEVLNLQPVMLGMPLVILAGYLVLSALELRLAPPLNFNFIPHIKANPDLFTLWAFVVAVDMMGSYFGISSFLVGRADFLDKAPNLYDLNWNKLLSLAFAFLVAFFPEPLFRKGVIIFLGKKLK